jgi:hypothetical protein
MVNLMGKFLVRNEARGAWLAPGGTWTVYAGEAQVFETMATASAAAHTYGGFVFGPVVKIDEQ